MKKSKENISVFTLSFFYFLFTQINDNKLILTQIKIQLHEFAMKK